MKVVRGIGLLVLIGIFLVTSSVFAGLARKTKEDKELWGNRGYIVKKDIPEFKSRAVPTRKPPKPRVMLEDELAALKVELQKTLAKVEIEESKRRQLEKELAEVKEQLEAFKEPVVGGKTSTYTVKKGDNLWKIAKRFYGKGTMWPKIYKANEKRIKDPNRIYPGQVLVIPLD